MPKLLIAQSEKNKKDRKAATSAMNMKALIEKRLKKDPEDRVYKVVTLNTKMKLANVVAIINSSLDKLTEHEGKISVETYSIDPEKTRGKWAIESVKDEAAPVVEKKKKVKSKE